MQRQAWIAFVGVALFFAIPFSSFAQDEKPEAVPKATVIGKLATATATAVSNDDERQPAAVDAEEGMPTFLFDGGVPTSVDDLKKMEGVFDALSKKLFPATVNIRMGQSQGSGVLVSSDGYILTAAHVIGKPNQVAQVFFPDGKRYLADTLGVKSGTIDSGMLKLRNPRKETFPFIELGISEDLKLGQWVMAVGHPGGMDRSRGLVARVGRIVASSSSVIRTDCTLVGGDSGGPLIDMNGDLIGIHSRIGGTLADNLHVPVDQYSDNWDKLAKGLLLHRRPYLGLEVVDDTTEVKSVVKGKAADKAGIEVGDVISGIENIEVATKQELGDAIRELELLPLQKIQVIIQRADKQMKLKLTVGER